MVSSVTKGQHSGRRVAPYRYSTQDVAALVGKAPRAIRRDVRLGRVALDDLESVSAYVASGILAHKAEREVKK